jgi:hypothetical protein
MKFIDLKLHIGKRVKLNGRGDLAIHGELRKFIYDDENKYYLILERITKGGKVHCQAWQRNVLCRM